MDDLQEKRGRNKKTPSSPISLLRRYSIDSGSSFKNRVADSRIIKKLKVLEFVNGKREDFENKLLSEGRASTFLRTKDKVAFLLAPNSRILFCSCFSFMNGPILLAVLPYRNSLVFHSLDKATSVLIHILPSVVTYSLRCLWNGANWYIEIFSKTYRSQIKEKEDRWKKIVLSSIGNNGTIVPGTPPPSTMSSNLNTSNENINPPTNFNLNSSNDSFLSQYNQNIGEANN
eukprot:gene2277-2804_t